MLGNTDPTKENNTPSTFQTDYCGNYVYEKSTANGNLVLQRIITPEGYITTLGIPNSHVNLWEAVYCMKDHQGNTRVTLTSDILAYNTSKVYTASDQIDYYPFGMERSNSCRTNGGPFNSGSTPYLYSGKEVDRMNGLNESDFSARWHDPAVPGFTSADPLAETHPWESPYSYCGANPVNRVDPTGMEWYWNDGEYPVWIDGCDDVDGYEYHNTDCYVTGLYGQNGYCYIHYTMGDDDNSNQDLLMLLQSAHNGGPNDGVPMFQDWHINQYPPGYGQPVVQKSAPVNKDNTLSKLSTALSGINGMTGLVNSQEQFKWEQLANDERNTIAYKIQKGLKADGERLLTSEIKAEINAGLKSTNIKCGAAGAILIAANVVINGEIKPSDVMNTVMTGIGMTGWGAPIAAGYFIIDMAFDVSGSMDKYGPIYDFKK